MSNRSFVMLPSAFREGFLVVFAGRGWPRPHEISCVGRAAPICIDPRACRTARNDGEPWQERALVGTGVSRSVVPIAAVGGSTKSVKIFMASVYYALIR